MRCDKCIDRNTFKNIEVEIIKRGQYPVQDAYKYDEYGWLDALGLGDINTKRPILANNTGGLSGPAIKPVAVRMVYQVSQAVNIPILGMGGIVNGDDAIEFMLAGATAISIGAGNFIDPYTSTNTVKGIEDYMKKFKIENINEIIGKVQMN